MTTTTTTAAPPPQHRHPHHKKKKNNNNNNNNNKSDPFFDLDLASPSQTTPSPSSTPQNEPQEPQDPLLTRILWTPIIFTSFLISLFLVNRSDRARRTASRAHPSSSRSSTWSYPRYLSPRLWIDPEPYQDPDEYTWSGRTTTSDSGAHYAPHSALNPTSNNKAKSQSWHLNKKISDMAKLEISDALEMRECVAILLIATVVMAIVGVFLGLSWTVKMAVAVAKRDG